MAKLTGKRLVDAISTIGAAFGSKPAITRLAKDVAQDFAGPERDRIITALRSATEYVPGAKPTVAEAIAQSNIGAPQQVGGSLVRLQRDLSGARGVADVLPSVARRQQKAIEEHIAKVKEATAPMREEALAQANAAGGVRADAILAEIDKELAIPGKRASDVVQKTLGAVKEKIASIAGETGVVDARDLYTVRKEMGNTISKFAQETANWDKRFTAALQRSLQGKIDDAIEGAGGTGWKEYLRAFSSGMKAVEQHEARLAEAKKIGAAVKGMPPSELAAGELPKVPTLLHRPMMFINFGLKQIGRNANDPLVKRITNDLQDPDKFADLLSRPLSDTERIKASSIMRMAAQIGVLQAERE